MSRKTSIRILLFLLLLVIPACIPYHQTWGGGIKNEAEMYVFEILFISFNIFLALILLMKGNVHETSIQGKGHKLRVFLGIFILNTVGNVFAKTHFEKFFYMPAMLFAVFIGMVLRKNINEQSGSILVKRKDL